MPLLGDRRGAPCFALTPSLERPKSTSQAGPLQPSPIYIYICQFWARGARTRMTPTLRHFQRFQATRLCIQCDIKGSHTKACNFLAQPSSVRAKATGQDRACADHTHTTVHHGLACAGSIRRPRADHTPHHRSSRSGMVAEASRCYIDM